LEAHGLPVDENLIIPGNFEDADAQRAVESLLTKNISFDAIFAGDDDSAIGAITALNAAGKRVPEDIAVVGFDDLPTSRFCNPPLTTVSATIGEAGYQSTQLLAKLINGLEVESMTLLPTRLVLRKSCGC
jgi:DNA-binding LacI/PurR family transcriptional regulator